MNFLVSKLDIVDMLINIDCKDDMVKMDDLVDACNKLPTVNCDNCIWEACIFNALDWDANIVRCKNCTNMVAYVKKGSRCLCVKQKVWHDKDYFCADGRPVNEDVIKLIQNGLRRKGGDEECQHT